MSPISQAKGSLNDSLSKSLSRKYIEKIENIMPFSAKIVIMRHLRKMKLVQNILIKESRTFYSRVLIIRFKDILCSLITSVHF